MARSARPGGGSRWLEIGTLAAAHLQRGPPPRRRRVRRLPERWRDESWLHASLPTQHEPGASRYEDDANNDQQNWRRARKQRRGAAAPCGGYISDRDSHRRPTEGLQYVVRHGYYLCVGECLNVRVGAELR